MVPNTRPTVPKNETQVPKLIILQKRDPWYQKLKPMTYGTKNETHGTKNEPSAKNDSWYQKTRPMVPKMRPVW